MFNEELARLALKDLKNNPEDWNQGDWRCESGMCFAGFVAFRAGARWADLHDEYDPDVVTPDNQIVHVSDYAAQQLGDEDGDDPDVHGLFESTNTIESLDKRIDWLSMRREEDDV